MKKIFNNLTVIFIVIFGFINNSCSDEKKNTEISENNYFDTISFLRETDAVLKTPESVKYNSETNILYVSNVNGVPTEKDGNGFISKISPYGKIIEKEWIKGLNAPKGMGIFEDKLYVSDIDEIVEISIFENKIIRKYKAKDAKFLNDIDIDNNGNIYISDTATGKIWILKNGKLYVWLQSDEIIKPNGLYANNENLYIGTKNKILSVDLKTKKTETFIDETGSIDGLELVGKNQFVFSDWSGHIYIAKQNENKKLLLNTASKNINAADIEFIKKDSLLLVPTFYHNTVSFYKLL